ncbi:MAG: hypothetical protein CFE26_17650 [Verrucomicrobiales bacterium VVV1]|nr:MAG: hypothetical protein CFE26_17650 [Verrucomicrobiales bacterium VVV1]
MMKQRVISFFFVALCQTLASVAQEAAAPIRLPLRVHLVTGVEMVREAAVPGADPVRTVMTLPVKVEDVRAMVDQVNEIWAPAKIRWETDPAKGGGGIVSEQAGGGKLTKERLQELAARVVARNREEQGDWMTKVFPALADPAHNEALLAEGSKTTYYHLYLFPYVGQTLQGTARLSGTFAVVGAYSDKSPNKTGFPKLRPFCVPTKPGTGLLAVNFPADGALSATMAHELGHNLGLTHSDEGMPDNLMKGHVKLRLSPGQIAAARKQALVGPRSP